MPEISWEDKDAFLQLDTVGGWAKVATWLGGPLIKVILDEETITQDNAGNEIRKIAPICKVKASDVPGIAVNAGPFVVDGKTYKVADWISDGTGFLDVHLIEDIV